MNDQHILCRSLILVLPTSIGAALCYSLDRKADNINHFISFQSVLVASSALCLGKKGVIGFVDSSCQCMTQGCLL